jgi:hypothetical protein
MTDLDVLEVGVVERVVEGQAGTAGDPEYVLDAFGLEGLTKGIGSAHSDGSPEMVMGTAVPRVRPERSDPSHGATKYFTSRFRAI